MADDFATTIPYMSGALTHQQGWSAKLSFDSFESEDEDGEKRGLYAHRYATGLHLESDLVNIYGSEVSDLIESLAFEIGALFHVKLALPITEPNVRGESLQGKHTSSAHEDWTAGQEETPCYLDILGPHIRKHTASESRESLRLSFSGASGFSAGSGASEGHGRRSSQNLPVPWTLREAAGDDNDSEEEQPQNEGQGRVRLHAESAPHELHTYGSRLNGWQFIPDQVQRFVISDLGIELFSPLEEVVRIEKRFPEDGDYNLWRILPALSRCTFEDLDIWSYRQFKTWYTNVYHSPVQPDEQAPDTLERISATTRRSYHIWLLTEYYYYKNSRLNSHVWCKKHKRVVRREEIWDFDDEWQRDLWDRTNENAILAGSSTSSRELVPSSRAR